MDFESVELLEKCVVVVVLEADLVVVEDVAVAVVVVVSALSLSVSVDGNAVVVAIVAGVVIDVVPFAAGIEFVVEVEQMAWGNPSTCLFWLWEVMRSHSELIDEPDQLVVVDDLLVVVEMLFVVMPELILLA